MTLFTACFVNHSICVPYQCPLAWLSCINIIAWCELYRIACPVSFCSSPMASNSAIWRATNLPKLQGLLQPLFACLCCVNILVLFCSFLHLSKSRNRFLTLQLCRQNTWPTLWRECTKRRNRSNRLLDEGQESAKKTWEDHTGPEECLKTWHMKTNEDRWREIKIMPCDMQLTRYLPRITHCMSFWRPLRLGFLCGQNGNNCWRPGFFAPLP